MQTQESLPFSDATESATIEKPTNGSKRLAFWLKVIFTAAVFAVIFATVNWSEVGGRLEKANIGVLFFAFVTLVGSIVLASLRWSIVATQHGVVLPFGLGLRLTFTAQFFGQTLPSTVGADAVRSWLAIRRGLSAFPVLSSVVVDRVCGLIGLSLLILAGLPRLLDLSRIENSLAVGLVALFLIAGVVGLVVMLLVARRLRPSRLGGRIQNLFAGSAYALASLKGLCAVGLSIVIQTLVVLSAILIAWSVDLPLGLIDGFSTVPAAMLVAFIPITINGWGLREGAMITAMGMAGISSADALVVSVLFGVLLLFASLPGALAWLSVKGSR